MEKVTIRKVKKILEGKLRVDKRKVFYYKLPFLFEKKFYGGCGCGFLIFRKNYLKQFVPVDLKYAYCIDDTPSPYQNYIVKIQFGAFLLDNNDIQVWGGFSAGEFVFSENWEWHDLEQTTNIPFSILPE